MSNSPLFHQEEATMLGMEVALAVLITKGPREGKTTVADFAHGVWLELHKPLRKRLGSAEGEQIELLANCLQLLCDRGFLKYIWKECKLIHTRKGWRARKAHTEYKKHLQQRQKAGHPVRQQHNTPQRANSRKMRRYAA